MNYDLITLVSKLRQVKSLEELDEVKALGESFMRKEKNMAILTIMAVAEELGDQEVLSSIDHLRSYLGTIMKK